MITFSFFLNMILLNECDAWGANPTTICILDDSADIEARIREEYGDCNFDISPNCDLDVAIDNGEIEIECATETFKLLLARAELGEKLN